MEFIHLWGDYLISEGGGLEWMRENFNLSIDDAVWGIKTLAIFFTLAWVLKTAIQIPAVDSLPCWYVWEDARVQYSSFHNTGIDYVTIFIFIKWKVMRVIFKM